MNSDHIQKQCEKFLRSLGVKGFILFGWTQDEEEVNLAYAYNDMPADLAIESLGWTAKHLVEQTMPE